MEINYWNCNYCDSEEIPIWTGQNQDPEYVWKYGCIHPKGNGYCDLDNKFNNKKDNCKLLDLNICDR